MGNSVLVFVSHSSEDKKTYVEPIVQYLEDCYINVWIDKRKILPGENLRKSIFREGLDKADIALIFFTEQSLSSSWVDREIKHVLREEGNKGNNFDLRKIISICDCEDTYRTIKERYPELTDDLLHLMPLEPSKEHLGQLVSAIWSKYLDLQGGDVEIQRQLLVKEKELFQRDKKIQELKTKLEKVSSKPGDEDLESEFEMYVASGRIKGLIDRRDSLLSTGGWVTEKGFKDAPAAVALGLIKARGNGFDLTNRGRAFFRWQVQGEMASRL